MPQTRIVAEPGSPLIEITREFAAPPDLVFRAHTEPALVVQWLGPRGYRMTVDRNELRHGGTWRYLNHDDSNGATYAFHGVYHGTPSVAGIVRTFEYEGWPENVSLERITFADQDGTTLVRAVSAFTSVADRDSFIESGMEDGVIQGHERLDELLARLVRER